LGNSKYNSLKSSPRRKENTSGQKVEEDPKNQTNGSLLEMTNQLGRIKITTDESGQSKYLKAGENKFQKRMFHKQRHSNQQTEKRLRKT